MRFSGSNRPSSQESPGSDSCWSTILNYWTTAGYTLRCLLAQRISSLPPSSPLPPLSTISILILISINVYNGPTYQLLAVAVLYPQ